MKITKVTPRGFCKGVVDAWDIAKKAKLEYPNHKVFLIGSLVHNKEMIKEVIKNEIEIIDDPHLDRLEMVKKAINKYSKENIVLVFSAHGTDQKIIDWVKKENIIYFDTVCKYVKKTHEEIINNINKNKVIFFIGVKNHPEAIATLNIDKEKIYLVEKELDVESLKKKINQDENIFVINQTTMSIYDFYYITKKIKNEFNNVEIKNDICLAAYERQKAIVDLDKSIDLLIVVGDKKSNNSNKMVEVGQKNKIISYLVETKNDLKEEWFTNKNHVAISSGASTPTWTTNEVIKRIENINITNK